MAALVAAICRLVDRKPIKNTTRGGRMARHPSHTTLTLPHRATVPPDRGLHYPLPRRLPICRGAPAGVRPRVARVAINPPRVPALVWSHNGSRRLSLLPAPMKVTCPKICRRSVFEPRCGLCLHSQRFNRVAPRGARSSSFSGRWGYLWLLTAP